jgi:integrase
MSSAPLAIATGGILSPSEVAAARELIENARSPATQTVRAREWARFAAYCAEHGLAELPAEPATVLKFVLYLAGREPVRAEVTRTRLGVPYSRTEVVRPISPDAIARYVGSIRQAHAVHNLADPTSALEIATVLTGLRRTRRKKKKKRAPLDVELLRTHLEPLGEGASLIEIRDRAIVLLGWHGALRSAEVAALDDGDVSLSKRHGMVLFVRTSKTDQTGEGVELGIPFAADPNLCAVRAVQRWREAAGLGEGPLFCAVDRHGSIVRRAGVPQRIGRRTVDFAVKRVLGVPIESRSRFGSQSLRSGYITSAIRAGAKEAVVMQHSRHKSVDVFRGYVRSASLFGRDHPSRGLV